MTHSINFRLSGNPLSFLGCAIFALIALRAWHQAITIDEADTALVFAFADWPAHWHPASNNHILNTAGIRLFTTLFGVSAFTVRLPALCGAALYLWAMYELTLFATPSAKLRVLLFAFSATNPLLLDHLVAARGYSLALGFLAMAVSILLRSQENRIATVGICCALSFLSNFSFAFAAASVVAAAYLRQSARDRWMRTALQAAVPALILTAAIASYTLMNWPKGEFVHGAQSWQETFAALASASGYTPSEFLLNPHLLQIFLQLTPVAFTVLPFAMLILLLADLKMSRSTPQGIVFGITLAALAAHAILHWQSNTLLPKDRTALWILFFLQVLAILIAARPTAAIAQTIVGVWLLCQLACLRLDHFKEWKFDANSDRLFDAFECVEPQLQQPPRIYTDWTVVSALNYYRYERQRWNFPVLAVEYELKTPPSGRDVYFLEIENQQEFIQREGLTVVYHDKVSGRGLAIRVPLKDLQKSTCPASLTDSVKSWRKTLANNGTPERTSTP